VSEGSSSVLRVVLKSEPPGPEVLLAGVGLQSVVSGIYTGIVNRFAYWPRNRHFNGPRDTANAGRKCAFYCYAPMLLSGYGVYFGYGFYKIPVLAKNYYCIAGTTSRQTDHI
jgi:hypothetical protein